MKFEYSKKETYSQQELDTLLNQHSEYMTKTIGTELKEIKTANRLKEINEIAKNIFHNERIGDALKLGNFDLSKPDKDLIVEMKNLAKEKSYLAKTNDGTKDENGSSTSNTGMNYNDIIQNLNKVIVVKNEPANEKPTFKYASDPIIK